MNRQQNDEKLATLYWARSNGEKITRKTTSGIWVIATGSLKHTDSIEVKR